jgi:hypothetical protein
LERIIEIYPIAEFPDMYNITLSAKAWDIIMDEHLVEYKPVEIVKFTSKN